MINEIDALVRRLVVDPHDEEALSYAHQNGTSDPKGYALLLERVGNETPDPGYASHWLSEAANVWATTIGDAHRAARVLMVAIDKDPTQRIAAERLGQLYREKGDTRALVALLDRRAKALSSLATTNPEIRTELVQMHEELGRLWADQPLAQPRKAAEHYRRAMELDPNAAFAIYSAREIYKSLGMFEETLAMYDAELAIEREPARIMALLRDEAETRRHAGDLAGATRAILRARQLDPQDDALKHQLANLVLDRVAAEQVVPAGECSLALESLMDLAQGFEGEHGFAYAGGALDLEPGSDRALKIFLHHARALGRDDDAVQRLKAYVDTNPEGAMSVEARRELAERYERTGQIADAIQMLEPLRATGDTEATNRLAQLYPQAAASSSSGSVPGVVGPMSDGTGRTAQLSPDKIQGVLDAGQMLAGKGKKHEAYLKYREVLETDAAHPEALSWVEEYLRTKRDYAQLRDVLMASVRAVGTTTEAMEARKERLREIAGLCEGNLRDVEGAVAAWKQLVAVDRADDSAKQSLARLLDKTQRWDELALLLEQDATAETDFEKKIAIERRLASLHEQKRRDFGAAAEAWSRITRLSPEDDRAILTASRLYEKAGQLPLAAQVLADCARRVEDPVASGALLERLGDLRELLNEPAQAGDAYAQAADALRSAKLWDAAERCFVTGERWDRAASAANQRAQLVGDLKLQAQLLSRAAEYLLKAGDPASAVVRLEQATTLDPTNDEYAAQLRDRYTALDQWSALVSMLTRRGDRLADRPKRVGLRREAATLCASHLGDKEQTRELWLKLLEDGDDREALERLVDYAVEREDHTEACTLLRRLGHIAVDKADKARIAMREAEILAEGMRDIDAAVQRYESVVGDLDSTYRPALQAIADLQESRGFHAEATDALERELKLVADVVERGQIAGRLARLYELLDNPHAAIRALDIVRKADLEDFDALARLCDLCERVEHWDRVAELLHQRIEVEGDESEASAMTKKLADILGTKLDRGDEALAALTELADQGDALLRQAYVELGDRLGWKNMVAQKLVDWWLDAKQGPERTTSLKGAFERFAEIGRDQDAVRVAVELVRAKAADRTLAGRLETLAVKTGDQDALELAHDLLVRELGSVERATELVRQAEVRVRAGLSRSEAIEHGETGLAGIPPADMAVLVERLAQLPEKPSEAVDVYERHATRLKSAPDRIRALARAAQVAGARGQMTRVSTFYELALSGSPTDETLALLERSAREGDDQIGGERLRRALGVAMAAGGQGARDGGKARSALLRRAASLLHRDLGDVDQAFAWLGDSLVAHVDALTLDALEGLGIEVGDPARAESTLSRALTEVFDGPLVRQLLARRARLRRDVLLDRPGAAADLRKLHDLSPGDTAVLVTLSGLLTELGDYRSLVQLYEDQILRGRDMTARAELARKVARMWEERLQDAREAADAWRRVLRMKPNDPEATQGLERSKGNMLKRPDPKERDAYAPPPESLTRSDLPHSHGGALSSGAENALTTTVNERGAPGTSPPMRPLLPQNEESTVTTNLAEVAARSRSVDEGAGPWSTTAEHPAPSAFSGSFTATTQEAIDAATGSFSATTPRTREAPTGSFTATDAHQVDDTGTSPSSLTTPHVNVEGRPSAAFAAKLTAGITGNGPAEPNSELDVDRLLAELPPPVDAGVGEGKMTRSDSASSWRVEFRRPVSLDELTSGTKPAFPAPPPPHDGDASGMQRRYKKPASIPPRTLADIGEEEAVELSTSDVEEFEEIESTTASHRALSSSYATTEEIPSHPMDHIGEEEVAFTDDDDMIDIPDLGDEPHVGPKGHP